MKIKLRTSSNTICIEQLVDFILKNEELFKKKLKHNQSQKSKSKKSKILTCEIDDSLYYKLKKQFLGSRIKYILELAAELSTEKELAYGKKLFLKNEGWVREVIVDTGRVDGVNHGDKRVVELKFLEGWKGALGQVLVYSHSFPSSYSKEIWLITPQPNKLTHSKKTTILQTCEKYGVICKFVS